MTYLFYLSVFRIITNLPVGDDYHKLMKKTINKIGFFFEFHLYCTCSARRALYSVQCVQCTVFRTQLYQLNPIVLYSLFDTIIVSTKKLIKPVYSVCSSSSN